ncbi:hypothetical protein SASPL_157620 [Salvia splendens]|uniref:Uncharacterized protein n=1 Tax=Salvia splendens TaxID=180675 RepID=A0A8X8VUK3_SALSN|nr:hypothetical protein SASPL_157620 [Salvia splendens]
MGNSFCCSASGERLVSAARDGDFVEAKMLLDCNPHLAKYSTFGGLNSPLHFAAAKGHNEIVALLLENGADVNSRNYCGQTALMQACRYGHWEVVQTLLLFRCNVSISNLWLLEQIILVEGLLSILQLSMDTCDACDWCSVILFQVLCSSLRIPKQLATEGGGSNSKTSYIMSALSKFVNKAADGGITGSSYGCGLGSTPLHYAACGGHIKCCQILLAKGASRLSLNCNGWLPIDVARMWGRHWLEPLLAPNSDLPLPTFPHSDYLSLPLLSVLNIARDYGLQSSATGSDDTDICAVCLERACSVAAEENASRTPHQRLLGSPDKRKNRVASVSSDMFCPVTCSLFPSVTIPLCTCNEGPCPEFDSREREPPEESPPPHHPQPEPREREKLEGVRSERTTCSNMFWGRRSCSRENQCNAEINA